MNKRRELVIALGASAIMAPLRSFAQQQAKIWRVGFLSQRHVDLADTDYYFGPFTRGMRELGYVEGKNLVIEWRSAEGKGERLPGLAIELANLKVDIIVGAGAPAVTATQKSGTTIPIVMVGVGDPVGIGLVKSLAHPGGNITGLSNITIDLGPKRLEMLLGVVPRLSRAAVLMNPDSATSHGKALEIIKAAAEKPRVTILPAEARTPQELETAFSMMIREKADALILLLDPFFQQQKNQIVQLAAKHRLPTAAAYGDYVEAGGLMSYGPRLADPFRRAAGYVDKILKGARPGDLPVEQPTKFELVINLKTAKALGLAIPQSLLLRADEVIQ